MAGWLYMLVCMSLAATVLGLPLLALRRVRKVPRLLVHLLWIPVAVRLAVPWFPSSGISAFRLAGGLIRRLVPFVDSQVLPNSANAAADPALLFMNFIGAADSYHPIRFADAAAGVLSIAAVVWAVVAVLLMIGLSALHLLARRRIAHGLRMQDGRQVMDDIDGPFVFGLFRQQIVFPAEWTECRTRQAHHTPAAETGADRKLPSETKISLSERHERVHLRRHDNLWRAVALGLCCLHWFNPFVWICLNAYLQDVEASCDAAAVRGLDAAGRVDYMEALLQAGSSTRHLPAYSGLAALPPSGSAFARFSTRRRLEWLMHGPVRSGLQTAACLAFLILSVLLLTNPTPTAIP